MTAGERVGNKRRDKSVTAAQGRYNSTEIEAIYYYFSQSMVVNFLKKMVGFFDKLGISSCHRLF